MTATLWDHLKDLLADKLLTIWHWTTGLASWTAIVACLLFILFYAATLDKKYSSKSAVAFISYIFVQILESVI